MPATTVPREVGSDLDERHRWYNDPQPIGELLDELLGDLFAVRVRTVAQQRAHQAWRRSQWRRRPWS